jgi:hypothetical protein
MKMTSKLASALLACLTLAGVSQASSAESSTAGSKPGVLAKVEHSVARGAKAAASGIERGAKAAGHGIKRGVSATARTADRVTGKLRRSAASSPAPHK